MPSMELELTCINQSRGISWILSKSVGTGSESQLRSGSQHAAVGKTGEEEKRVLD